MSVSEPIHYERLDGSGSSGTAAELLGAIDLRARAARARPHVMLNMVSTLDGRAALDGHTKELGGPADLEMLLELRVLVDAVLVGGRTVNAGGYGRLMRRPERRERRVAAGLVADPLAVVASRSLDLRWDADLFAAREQPVLIYTSSEREPPSTIAPVELMRIDPLTPAAMLADLRARGNRSLLCEGGPTLSRALLGAGAVDELFMTLAPLLTGDDAQPGFLPGPAFAAPVPASLRWALRHGSELFLRYGFDG